MSFLIVIISLAILIALIARFKVDAFLAFILVSAAAGIALGIPLDKLPATIETGIGNLMGSLTLIIVLGAMLGKLVAVSGAAGEIASGMTSVFGTKRIRWGLMITGFIVGIPLFYGIGFVLLVPLIFTIVNRYRLPAVFIGLPMLSALSVTHGFLPPHPSPVALVSLFDANMGMTLIWGLVIAVPAIILAGPVFSGTLRKVSSKPVKLFESAPDTNSFGTPGKINSLLSATLPVFLLIAATVLPMCLPEMGEAALSVVKFLGAPPVVMLIALIVATCTLGIAQGRSIKSVMEVYVEAVKDIAMILLIIAGSGVFTQMMKDSGVSAELAVMLQSVPIHPLILGWLMAALIRVCVGSATVAALTAAGVILPLVRQTGVEPSLMVLSLGAGSLFFSHVNDSGFWLFKEYFGLSLKDTFRSWSVMETIVSVTGLAGVMILNLII
ncbi:MAG: gluconate:H+ symporter [Tannerellaceae bacterium]|jgi:Gnt-I system high-affinity gluconate transporter|nr:gluconate:H+ symporter [Tannerellaceae bacterium]